MLKFQLVSLAKNHNFYGQIDRYMKEFIRICLETSQQGLLKNLESLLNSEVSIGLHKSEDVLPMHKDLPRELHENILAQPNFNFVPGGMKMAKVQSYLDLAKEHDRTREAISLLKKSIEDPSLYSAMTSSFDQFFNLVDQLEND